jgi:hypothetical protein
LRERGPSGKQDGPEHRYCRNQKGTAWQVSWGLARRLAFSRIRAPPRPGRWGPRCVGGSVRFGLGL